MLIFQLIAFSLELFAILLGIALFIWGLRNQGAGTTLAKIAGLFTSALACLVLLYTVYYSWFSVTNTRAAPIPPLQFEVTRPTTPLPPAVDSPLPPSPSHSSVSKPEEKPDATWRPTHS